MEELGADIAQFAATPMGAMGGEAKPRRIDQLYFGRLKTLVGGLVFLLAYSAELGSNFQRTRSTYFLHTLFATVVCWVAFIWLQDRVRSWMETDTQALRFLWYKWLLNISVVLVGLVSGILTRTVSQKLNVYLADTSLLSLDVAPLALIIATVSFAIVMVEHELMPAGGE